MTVRSITFSILAVALLAMTALPLPAQAQNSPPGEGIAVDFKDIELPELIQTMSELTGRNFVYDETVRGKITIISPRRMTLDEAYNVFLSVLNVKGYTVVPSGKVHKIVMIKDAKESNLPVIAQGRPLSGGEQYVTRLVTLDNVDAAEIASTVLAPLVPKTSNIVAYPPSNTLIITDSAANIDRLVGILRRLDVPGKGDNLEVIPLEHAEAEEIAALVTQFIEQQTTRTRRRAAANVAAASGKEPGKIIPFKPTNVLVALAAADEMEMIKSLVKRLDQRPSQARSGIQVYYLENADAETLAETLNQILTGIKTQNTSAAARRAASGQAEEQTLEAVTITADKPTNSLIINSTPEDYDTIRDIIQQLDIKRKQVYVEALIMELSMGATQKLGATLQGAIATGDESAIFGGTNRPEEYASVTDPSSLLSQTIEGILLGGLYNMITVIDAEGNEIQVPALSALIDLSKTDGDVNILSAPRLLTSDNEEAEIIVGQNVPIITSRLTDSTGGGSLAQSVSVERQDAALTLRFTPQITEGDLVRLNVYQEITSVQSTNNEIGPTFTKRLLRNTVLAENSRTVVLGGLIDTTVEESVTKVPLLGDIPVLGWLFKRTSSRENKTNLLIFITPHIIKNAEDLERVTRRARRDMNEFQDVDMTDEASRKVWTDQQFNLEGAAPELMEN